MSRASVLILIGILAIVTPLSGLPMEIRTLIAIGLGGAVIGIGVALRSSEQHRLVAAQSSSLSVADATEPEPVLAAEAAEPHAPRVISSF